MTLFTLTFERITPESAALGDATYSVNWDAYRLMQKRFEARLEEIEPL